MKLPVGLNRSLTIAYLRRRRVQWSGEVPLINMLCPPKFMVYGQLVLGSGVKFITELGTSLLHVDEGAAMTIGDHVVVNARVWIRATKVILIEDYVRIAPGVSIFDSNLHPVSPGDKLTSRPVRLGRNSWLCDGSTVLKGVHIGNHSIVGSRSVVKENVSPKVIVEGNPGVVVGEIDCPDDWIRS